MTERRLKEKNLLFTMIPILFMSNKNKQFCDAMGKKRLFPLKLLADAVPWLQAAGGVVVAVRLHKNLESEPYFFIFIDHLV